MGRLLKVWVAEFFVLLFYKFVFDLLVLPKYMSVFSYMFRGAEVQFNGDKYIISSLAFLFFSIILINNKPCRNQSYNAMIRFIYYICIIPMLSVYTYFDSIDFSLIIYPFIFYVLLILCLKNYGTKDEAIRHTLFDMPNIKGADYILLFICGFVAVSIWAAAGYPLVFSFEDAYEQRMQLRAAVLPTIINYIFFLMGNTIFPYLFAKNIAKKKYVYAVTSMLFGLLLYFVNGMKTWLLLYPLFFGIAFIAKLPQNNKEKGPIYIGVMMCFLSLLCVLLFDSFNFIDLLSQFGRATIIPPNIGFTSIDFFRNNELLYLRESILGSFFDTPYVGGSDFYIIYGLDSTLTSSRANNGLWGDAFRNFGFMGIIIYPFLIAKIYSIVEFNCRKTSYSLKLYVLFVILWSSINTSFFTWIVTGGVLVLILLEKIEFANNNASLTFKLRGNIK